MQSTLLPSTLCNSIDKKIRNFLCESSQERRKIHLASWEVVTIGKDYGGFGIRSMKPMNLAVMENLGWRLLTYRNELWA